MAEKKERKSLKSPIGTATFVHLWEPHAFKSSTGKQREPQYSVLLVFDAETSRSAEMKALKLACIEAAEAKFGADTRDKIKKYLAGKKGGISVPWRDATEYEEYGEPFTEEGALMINFKSNTAPGIVDRRAKPITEEGALMINFKSNTAPGIVDRRAKPIMDRKEIYAGCKMRVSFGIWPFDTDGNKGVTLLLNNVQKTGDGPKLAGRVDAEDDFDAIEGDDDDDMEDDSDI